MRRRCGRGSERRRIVEVGDGGAGVVGAVAVCPLDLCAVARGLASKPGGISKAPLAPQPRPVKTIV